MVAIDLKSESIPLVEIKPKFKVDFKLPTATNVLDFFLPKLDYSVLKSNREAQGENPFRKSLFRPLSTDMLDDFVSNLDKGFWLDIKSRYPGRIGSLRFIYHKFLHERLG